MQQVAEPLHISKKTIYTVYPSKEALLLDMVDHAFAEIHRCKQDVYKRQVPGYDPEHLADSLQAENSPFLDRALQCYAVGSVFKPVLAAAALEAGTKPSTPFSSSMNRPRWVTPEMRPS